MSTDDAPVPPVNPPPVNSPPVNSPSPGPQGAGRWLRVALVVSVALNLMVAGVVAGGMIRAARMDTAGAPGVDLRDLWRALPDEARREMRAAMPDHRDNGRALRDERRARDSARQAQMLVLLRAEPFDPVAFAALLDDDRRDRASRIEVAHRALAERLAALAPAERAAIATRLERRQDRRPGMHRD